MSDPIWARARRLEWHWDTLGRIAAGLVCLGVALVAIVALTTGLPQRWVRGEQRDVLMREAIAQAALPWIERGDRQGLQAQLDRVVRDDASVAGIVVARADGVLFAYARATPRPGDAGPLDTPWASIPIDGAGGRWGTIAFQASPSVSNSVSRLTRWAAIGVGVLAFAFAGYYVYLRRALAHLDPTSVIPERVRQAFDVLTQGVVFLDAQGRIVLANDAFRRTCAPHAKQLTGRSIEQFAWLASGGGVPIWSRVMRLGEPVRDESYRVPLDDHEARHVVVHGAPVRDTAGHVRGCLLTFDDVTELERANAQLRAAMTDLEASRAHIAAQNVKLQELASRDALTGCLNRRALHEAADPLFALAARNGAAVSCVMFDIDHFKHVNDKHGHATGDEVIRRLARLASARARSADLLCRYGGEEFCLVLPDTTAESAISIAGVLRATIERECGAAIGPGHRVTSSFGVASTRDGARTLDALMALADEALYAAKRAGRNRVEVYRAPAGATVGA